MKLKPTAAKATLIGAMSIAAAGFGAGLAHADPLLFSGGCTVRCCVRVTMQSDHAFWSPTVDTTTGLNPALLSAL